MSKRVPKLRFEEFSGEWEEKRLGDIGKVSMCKRILKSQTSTQGDIPFYKIGTFGKKADAFISRNLFEEYKKKYSYPKIGDILISASGTIGRLVVFDGTPSFFQDSNIVWIDNDENIVKNRFLYYVYQNIKWVTDDSTISRLYNDNLKNIKIIIPQSPNEQQKIANTLSSLDNLIEAEEKKVEALKKHKKGLMQQLFPQEGEKTPKLRFKEFSGEWEEIALKKISNITTGVSNREDSTEAQGKYTFFDRSEDIRTSHKYLFNDEAIIVAGEGQKFTPKYFKGKFDLHQRTYAILELQIIGKFLYYYINKNKSYFLQNAVGSTVKSLRLPMFEKMPILLPTLPEQQKIANTLSSLDNLIEAHEKKVEALKKHKKGLMQQMFVSEES